MVGQLPPAQNGLFYDFCLEQYVPQDHLLRQHFAGAAPGLAGKGFFDLEKDPREEYPLMAQFLWAWWMSGIGSIR